MTMLRRILISSVVALAPLPATAATSLVYVTNSAGDMIDVVNPDTDKVVQTIGPIEGAHGINFSPDGARVYVSNEATSTLDVFDRKSGKPIKKIALSNHPNNIAVAPDGRVIVGIRGGKGALDIVDPKTLAVKKTLPMRGPLHNVYVTPDGKYGVMGSLSTGFVTVVDLATEKEAWAYQFDLGIRPMAIEANPDGSTKRIFIQMSKLDGFAVLDFATRKETARIELPDLHTGVDMDKGREDAPSHGIGVAPDGKTLWVTSIPQNAVFIYSLDGLKLQGHIALPDLKLAGRAPGGAVANWVTFTPEGKLYISNSGLKSVTAIDTKTRKIVAVVPVGEVPKRINTLVMR